jgi:hypothetical protein
MRFSALGLMGCLVWKLSSKILRLGGSKGSIPIRPIIESCCLGVHTVRDKCCSFESCPKQEYMWSTRSWSKLANHSTRRILTLSSICGYLLQDCVQDLHRALRSSSGSYLACCRLPTSRTSRWMASNVSLVNRREVSANAHKVFRQGRRCEFWCSSNASVLICSTMMYKISSGRSNSAIVSPMDLTRRKFRRTCPSVNHHRGVSAELKSHDLPLDNVGLPEQRLGLVGD